jgi:hypothetical protein
MPTYAIRNKIELLSKPEIAALETVIATLNPQIQALKSHPDPTKQRQLIVFERHLKTCNDKLAANVVLGLHYDGILGITKAQRREFEQTVRPTTSNRFNPCRCLCTTISNICQSRQRKIQPKPN